MNQIKNPPGSDGAEMKEIKNITRLVQVPFVI